MFDQIGGDRIFVERAGLEPLDPDADQIARQVVALRQAVERLAREKLLCDLTLELETVSAVFRLTIKPPIVSACSKAD